MTAPRMGSGQLWEENRQLPMDKNSAGSTGSSLQVTPKWTWVPSVLSTMAESEA